MKDAGTRVDQLLSTGPGMIVSSRSYVLLTVLGNRHFWTANRSIITVGEELILRHGDFVSWSRDVFGKHNRGY